ncbi:MAG: hypothetical protein PGN07_02920 [Aeromicrobium erythreum]
MTSHAERLGIGTDQLVWIVGDTVEESALLDPLPPGTDVVRDPDEVDDSRVDAALVVIDDPASAAEQLDDTLPRLGSVRLVWILLSQDHGDPASIARAVDDYGWTAGEAVELDEDWLALPVEQA